MDASTCLPLLKADYDYVVVGGGTAGLIVGCRLSEDDEVKVIVLEAGDSHLTDPRINTPAGWSAVLGSEVDWNFKTSAQVQTFKGLQYGLSRDPFASEAMGGYSSPITVDPESKTRSYAANTYFTSATQRPNLTVLTGISVNNIILDTGNGPARAKGVRVTVKDIESIVKASKEVILAAGVFQTPKLLELSGVGDRKLLESHGIHVVIDNPNIGENLQDHLMTGISFEVMDGIFTGDGLMRQEPEIMQMAMEMYTTAKAGPLCAGGIGSYAFMPLLNSLGSNKIANLERLVFECKSQDPKDTIHYDFVRSIIESDKKASASMFMFPAQVNLHNNPSMTNFTQDLGPGNYVSLGVALLHPLSRGSVHIKSANASQEPHIDPKYLSDALDVEIFAHHLRFLERLAQSEPLASLLKPNGRRNHPTAFIKDMNGGRNYVRQSAISNNHPASTCAMKPRENEGLVNERLVVHGTTNLRVVDASIMPTIPGGNIQSSVYAVAERAADLIKEDAG
ncbi:MAG: hypothetical protein ASARMPRED_004595 [Alectoria sarmentosa]|nr:MAG: hypothetical protein ASARMPRED_004595 [Alectoria sarmentosa]